MQRQIQKDIVYLSMAFQWSKLSRAKRKKVGALIVKDERIISDGFNGTPIGFDNCCELDGHTKPEVLHAESNAITKLATSTQSSEGSTLYLTLSPCYECAKLIIQARIIRVVFSELYRISKDSLQLLKDCGVEVKQYSKEEIQDKLWSTEQE